MGDLARTVAAVTEVGDCGHVDPFSLGGPLVPVSEEPAVQFVVDELLGCFGIAQRDRATLSFSPNGLTPLLEKVRIPVGAVEDEIECVLVELDLRALRRDRESSRSRESCHQQRQVVIFVALENARTDPATVASIGVGLVRRTVFPTPRSLSRPKLRADWPAPRRRNATQGLRPRHRARPDAADAYLHRACRGSCGDPSIRTVLKHFLDHFSPCIGAKGCAFDRPWQFQRTVGVRALPAPRSIAWIACDLQPGNAG